MTAAFLNSPQTIVWALGLSRLSDFCFDKNSLVRSEVPHNVFYLKLFSFTYRYLIEKDASLQ